VRGVRYFKRSLPLSTGLVRSTHVRCPREDIAAAGLGRGRDHRSVLVDIARGRYDDRSGAVVTSSAPGHEIHVFGEVFRVAANAGA
jgi:hypothetical protein